MSRFLTPSKVGLLVLISVYREDVIPTAESVQVLSFLISHILPDSKHASAGIQDVLEHHLSIGLFESTLARLNSVMPGRSVYDLFLKKMWSIDSGYALDDFIHQLPSLLARSREQILRDKEAGVYEEGQNKGILRTSPLGAFIRRCYLEFTRLQFQDAMKLWQDLIAFRALTWSDYEKKKAPDGRNALDVNLLELKIDSSHPLALIMYGELAADEAELDVDFSVFDVEKLMEFHVSEMQRLGGRLSSDMRLKMMQITKAGESMPKLAYYLKFLDSWRAGDYTSALENLHRYFDYTMQTRDRVFYQYALLNLAILQADFGCHAEAIPAMQEAIATARENKDTTCLNYCMSWLYHFGRAFPSEMKSIRESGILGSETEGLTFLKSRAKDAEMWTLLTTSLLSEAKLGLQHGDSLANVFENITKASHISITKALMNTTGPTLLMRAATFTRVGVSHLSWITGETFLECYSKEAPIEDQLKSICRMASLLTQQGRYTEADKFMSDVPAHILRVLKFNNYRQFYGGLLKLRRLIHRSDFDAATRIATRLQGQGPPDMDVSCILAFLQIELSLHRNHLSSAITQIESLASKTADTTDVHTTAHLLNLKARILITSSNPLKAFSLTTRAAQLSLRARLLPTLWESIVLLSQILLALREFTAATSLLHSIIPQILECHDNYLAARAYSALADTHIGHAGCAEAKSNRRKEQVNKAMEYLESARVCYRYMEDVQGQLDVLEKMASVMRWRGDLVLANDVASRYLAVRREYEVKA
jgi:anaphase-promoting complex subunit 5